MAKRKVVIDIQYLLVAQTGLKTYIEQLLDVIRTYPSENFEYIVVPSLKKANSTFFKQEGAFRSILFQLHTLWWKQVQLPYLLWVCKADFLFCPEYFAPAWKLRATKLAVFHDAFFWENQTHYNRVWLGYFKWMIKRGMKKNAHILTISNDAQFRLNSADPDFSLTRVLYNCGQDRIIGQFSEDSIGLFGCEKGRYFLHVGVMEKRKNLTTLIGGFSQFLQNPKFSEYKLVLVGQPGPKKDMDDWSAIQELILALRLDQSVITPGYLSASDLEQFYHHALAYVFPSTSEGFGYPLLEAFAHGVPTVISENEALVEVSNGSSLIAKSLDPSDWCAKMDELAQNPAKRNELIEAGYSRLQEFSKQKYFERLEKILTELSR